MSAKTTDGASESPSQFGVVACSAIAFSTGVGVLTLEVTAARVLMPWFGASTVVWTNVIGVTLGAIALGNFVGGRLADRARSLGGLAWLLAAAAVLSAAFPYLVPITSRSILPTDLPLEAALPVLSRGSLFVCLVALAPALVLMGAVSPILVRTAARSGSIGASAGLISGTATLGSLIGTWIPIHYLIPYIGSKHTCALAGLLLAAISAWLFLRNGRRHGVLAAGLVLVSIGFIVARADGSPGRAAVEGSSLREVESRYQYARVERNGDRTALKLNEGLDSFHSYTIEGRLLTDRYYDPFLLLPQTVEQSGDRFDVLILGFAAGTFARQLLSVYAATPSLRIVGIELDPEVAALGFEYFGLPRDPRLELILDQDARVFVDHSQETFELILVDVYANQIYVPFHTCSVEFFRSALARLSKGGVLAANLGGFGFEDRPLRAICNTAASVFGEVSLIRCPNSRNFMLLGARERRLPDLEGCESLGIAELDSVVESFRDPTLRRDFTHSSDELTLTDDRSPIEEMANVDFAGRARRALSAARTARSR